MQSIILTVGIPASAKSTWAKEQVANNSNTIRINRDIIRDMLCNYVFSSTNEKLVVAAKNDMIRNGLKTGRDIIIDETNINRQNFVDVCKIVKSFNVDCVVSEKLFYIDLDVAILRDSLRNGIAKVGEDVIRKFWKKSGGKQLQKYSVRSETILKQSAIKWQPMVQDETLPFAIICDLDGTLATIGDRSPYYAENCDIVDLPNEPVVNAVKLYNNAGYKIIFCSGRMEKDRAPTIRFIEKYLPNIEYLLFMRKDDDMRRDSIVKEEIFNNNIRNNYNVKAVIDDRAQVCRKWYSMGLNLFRVGDPDADF